MKQARAVQLVLAVTTIISVRDALPGIVQDTRATRVSTTIADARHGGKPGRRFLRGSPLNADSEERSPNVDIIVKDAASKFKKSVLWKFQFAV
ncbi:hypothetical protein PHYSODRAFT_284493 [Phytophthora sojae]|uniref:RxLR effector protein n=2 Tax=Phytophthora sojae TaxID=67593 RepID=G4YE61_PHYSP|nr:hypothetical protein PHYSODRAFT_284493 [Phytophthora sojae]AEK80720.1 Avh132 [Phytophthora sojae]AEK80721.1 Avh132 [Phytophthora sojae]AEK80722.1 Avh132 [Phytophthora sojae]EGZ29642.1 hypothetical protein PHYSODRAFT_284493 [Phytophthora sojae]|eukprot:XP_009516917.1 hypothetical protein PHYSODRAFT_284493 [Phytophthora sojae]